MITNQIENNILAEIQKGWYNFIKETITNFDTLDEYFLTCSISNIEDYYSLYKLEVRRGKYNIKSNYLEKVKEIMISINSSQSNKEKLSEELNNLLNTLKEDF